MELTTSGIERYLVVSYRLGAAGFIAKPINVLQLIVAVDQLRSYWFELVQPPENQFPDN
ncbi:MAG: hypothetical protein NTX56_08975 [Proteobacteria bacterium]|nr:hypothetical protein [Pseudomonadota bacterium]